MNGRMRKLGLGAVLVGGTLLFGVGLAGAQSPSSGGGGGGDRPPVLIAHPNDGNVMIGGSAGSSGCGGDGGATAAAVSSIDL
jgi:hypothetical protein